MSTSFFIGWDVGGWNCDRNKSSRDAIVILDQAHEIVGTPWRGNIRKCIAGARDAVSFVSGLFSLCRTDAPETELQTTLAIDTPLGFPSALLRLAERQEWQEPDANSGQNHYLFRETERLLHAAGHSPLSAVKDMIGSQATKGMHVVAKFTEECPEPGVWKSGDCLTIIEAYPSVTRDSQEVQAILRHSEPQKVQDCEDARVCAAVAALFANQRETLATPPEHIYRQEGWIWAPREAYEGSKQARASVAMEVGA